MNSFSSVYEKKFNDVTVFDSVPASLNYSDIVSFFEMHIMQTLKVLHIATHRYNCIHIDKYKTYTIVEYKTLYIDI